MGRRPAAEEIDLLVLDGRVKLNRAARDLALDPDDLVELDAAFEPPPRVGGAPLPGGPGGRL